MPDKIHECLAIKDDKEAFNCAREVVKTSTEPCKPKIVLLTMEDCSGCEEELALHKADIESGLIKHVKFNSPEGQAIAKINEIEWLPSVLLLDCNNKMIE